MQQYTLLLWWAPVSNKWLVTEQATARQYLSNMFHVDISTKFYLLLTCSTYYDINYTWYHPQLFLWCRFSILSSPARQLGISSVR